MNEADMYTFLEKTFFSTFFDELIPGIFHNFANPLNGIMGRSKLLQKRLVDFVMNMEKRCPDIKKEMDEDCAKLISDIAAIDAESEKMYDLFRVSAGKFYAIGARGVGNLNVSNLLETEMNFADFYLDFKHNVKKEFRLDKDVPDISGVTAFYSMAFWTLIRHAMKKIGNGNHHVFFMETDHDDRYLSVKINTIDRSLFQGWQEFSLAAGSDLNTGLEGSDEAKSLYYALLLLKAGNKGVEITHNDNKDMLTIRIPYRLENKED